MMTGENENVHESPVIQPLTGAQEKLLHRRDFLKMAAMAGGSAIAMSQVGNLMANAAEVKMQVGTPASKTTTTTTQMTQTTATTGGHPMQGYNAQNTIQAMEFPNLSTVEGISQKQLTEHLGLYKGYVTKINEIQKAIAESPLDIEKMNATYHPYRELHVEQTYALNGVVLHEAYFQNLGGTQREPGEMTRRVFTQEFGSWDNYVNHLLAVGKSMRGWAITGYNMRDHRIHNYGLDLHNQWVPMNVIPLLVLDVYEHAYMIDFGTKRPAYLEAFMRNVNWAPVEDRLKTMMFHA